MLSLYLKKLNRVPLSAAAYHLEDLPEHTECTDNKHQIAKGTDPTQCLQEILLHKAFAACVPQPFGDAGMSLINTDGQQAGDNHQHQAAVERPETDFHQPVIKRGVGMQIASDQQNKTQSQKAVNTE